jgi:acyl-CoA synthetase (AMP-forming)/AMP-acid ligase II
VEIVGERELPLNGAGKVDRRAVRDWLAARARAASQPVEG